MLETSYLAYLTDKNKLKFQKDNIVNFLTDIIQQDLCFSLFYFLLNFNEEKNMILLKLKKLWIFHF